MKNTSKSSKLLSFIMAFLILLVSLPTYALASLALEETSQGLKEAQTAALPEEEGVYVLEEDISLREENVKHFKLSNGTVKAVSYANAVHYLDAEGNWIDIDNSLTLNGSEYTANNKQEIKFANKSDSNGLLSIKDGEYKIDFTPLNTNKVSVEIENPQENNSRKFDDVKKLNNIVSKATYKGIYEGIDLEYILVGNNIKENIIVNKKQEEYTYSFEIKLSKLNATLENNMVVLTDSDTGEKVYEIPAPYMVDANGEYSDKVEYTLTKDSKWKYTFTVKADPEWINEEERQLPVKIDPSIIEDSSGVTDLFLLQYDGMEHNYPSLIVGNYVGNKDSISFIKFSVLPDIPDGAKLMDAKLVLYASAYINCAPESSNYDFRIGIYECIKDWGSQNGNFAINYQNASTYYSTNNIIASEIISSTGSYEWNIASLYNDWKFNDKENHGICLKGLNLPTIDGINAHFSSSENTNFPKPHFEVSYTHLIGVEDYYAYAENTLGNVGKSYVNLYNGSLTYVNHLTSVEVGPNLTYDIDMVYNSIEKTWRPSFAECIMPYDDDGEVLYGVSQTTGQKYGIERYLWRDPDGTLHAFTPYLEKNAYGAYLQFEISSVGDKWGVSDPTVFYPEDDIDYVLIQTINNEFILRDYDGNQKMFDSQGRLSKVCDAQGNVIFINNYAGENNMASIYKNDSDGNVVFLAEFFYLNSRRLSHINDIQNQKKIQFVWGNVGVTKISYKNFEETIKYKQIDFEYNDSNETDLACVLDRSIKQKIKYYTNTKNTEDKTDDEKIIEIINVNATPEQTIKKYIVDYALCRDLGLDFTANTNDDLLTTFTFDEKGRDASVTYDDSLSPNSSYYSVVYSQNIYVKGFNLVKYDMISKETDFLNFDIQNISNTSTINTNTVTTGFETVSNTQVSPYNIVCQIFEYYDGREEPIPSTGFLCGDNTIIMSGHSIREDLTNNNVCDFNFPLKIEVVPGRYLDENGDAITPFGVYEVTSFYVSKDYYYALKETDSSAVEFDWAVCELDRNVDEELGYFDIMVAPDEVSGQYIKLLGYYNDKMRLSTGIITSNNEKRIFYNAPTNDGISGSPIFFNDGNYIVFGIHTTGSGGTSVRGGTRINHLICNLVEYLNV